MSDRPTQPDDLTFLLSRSLDEDLSADQRQRLDETLADSASLRAEAVGLSAVDRLVKRWGEQKVEFDWQTQEALILAAAQDGESLADVDDLVARWGETEVPHDEAAFVDGVLGRIAAEQPAQQPAKTLPWYRIGVPLAAAAAIVFAVTAQQWFVRPAGVCEVVFGVGADAETHDKAIRDPARLVVQFARASVERAPAEPPGLSYGSVGAAPLPVTFGEREPS